MNFLANPMHHVKEIYVSGFISDSLIEETESQGII